MPKRKISTHTVRKERLGPDPERRLEPIRLIYRIGGQITDPEDPNNKITVTYARSLFLYFSF